MSILVLTGVPGSGKGHQAMKYFIVENFANGRHIKTNMSGLKLDKIREYCIKKYPNIDPEKFGTIEMFHQNDIEKDNFYPYLEYGQNNEEIIRDENSIIKGGDVLILDEAGKVYGNALKKPVLEYFTMHRHFVDKNNYEAEIILMVQSLGLLTTKLKQLVKNTYECRKLDNVGMSGRYYLAVYSGGTNKKAARFIEKQEAYDTEIFTLYDSQSGGAGKENKVDKRINLLKSPKMIALGIAILVAPILLIYTLYSFFNPTPKKVESSIPGTVQNSNGQVVTAPIQPAFKIVGVMDSPTKRMIFLQDQNNSIKLVAPNSCSGVGMLLVCKIDNNQEVSYYTNIKTNNNGILNENKTNNSNTNNNTINK